MLRTFRATTGKKAGPSNRRPDSSFWYCRLPAQGSILRSLRAQSDNTSVGGDRRIGPGLALRGRSPQFSRSLNTSYSLLTWLHEQVALSNICL